MALAATDDLTQALSATKQFLLPFDAGRWFRLAVIAFFVGGAGGVGGSGGNGSVGMPDGATVPDITLSNSVIAAIAAIVVLLLVLGITFAIVGAVMEFVLVESLRQETVHLRRFARRYWRGGLRLFGFRVGVGLLGLVGGLAVLGGAFLAAGGPSALQSPARLIPAALLAVPLVVLVALATGLVLGFTSDFVVPVMLLEGTTVLGGWRRFWPTLRAEWREYAVYLLVAFVLRLAVGVLFSIVLGIVAVGVLIPFGVVGVGVYLAGGGQLGLVTLAVLGGLGLLALFAIIVLSALASVPIVTYFRYYALLVLGDTQPAFDVIADRRAALRAAAND